MQALFTLTPAESRRLIAKAVALLPEVRRAQAAGRIIIGNPTGGTMGAVYNTVFLRNAKLIIPVGLEKLVPSVLDAAAFGGMHTWDLCLGLRCALWPVTGATVITEIEALSVLAGVEAVHFASGGIGNSAGAVTLAIAGEDGPVRAAFELVKSIKGEPPLADAKRPCSECENHCDRF